jgi:hypothetical protein
MGLSDTGYREERCDRAVRPAHLLYRIRPFQERDGDKGVEIEIKCGRCGALSRRRYVPEKMLSGTVPCC